LDNQWYLLRDNDQYGPYSWEELLYFAESGNVNLSDRVWSKDYQGWVEVRDVPALRELLLLDQTTTPKKKSGLIVGGGVGAAILVALAVFFLSSGGPDFSSIVGGEASRDYAPQTDDGIYILGYDTVVRYTGDQALQVDLESAFGTQTATLNADNPRFIHENVSLEMSPIFLEEGEAQVEVSSMLAPPPFDEAEVNAYSFHSSNAEAYDGLYTITLPYEPGRGVVGAGYYNEAAASWEPVYFELDEANNQVIITTDHLSTFGSVTIIGEGTRAARIATGLFDGSNYLYNFTSDHGIVVDELIRNNMNPAEEAWKLGKSVTDDWFKASGIIFKFESLAYSSEFISSLSDAMTNVGTALALTQLAIDYSRGDQQAMAVNAFNTAQGLAIGKWGTKALKVSMIGVTVIDYALSSFRTEALAGRQEIWIKAYELYYSEESKVKRTPSDWYYRLKEVFDHAESPEQFHRMLDAELTHYTELFWNDDEITQAFYQSQAQKHGWTGGGGLNESLKKEISENYKNELLDGYLKSVFLQLERKARQEQIDEYYREFDEKRAMFNQVVNFNIEEIVPEDEDPEFAGYIIQFGPLAEEADARNWTGRMRDDGTARTRFTVLSHLMAGAPDELRFYESREDLEKEEPAHVVDFVISLPETKVYLGELAPQDLSGLYQGYLTITDIPFLEEARRELEQEIAESEASQGDATSIDPFNLDESFLEECEPALGLIILELLELMIGLDVGLTIELSAEEEDISRYAGRVSLDPSDITIDPALIEEKMAQFEEMEVTEREPGEAVDDGDEFFGNFIAMLLGLSEPQDIAAVYENGELVFYIYTEEEDGVYHYRGRLTADDTLEGTFDLPVEEEVFLNGSWQVTRQGE